MLLKVMVTLLAVGGEAWQDLQLLDPDFKEKSLEDYECSDGQCDLEESNDAAVKKKENWLSSLYDERPHFQTSSNGGCVCRGVFQREELSPESFPRDIRAYVCSPNACPLPLRCHQKYYEVHVLKPRGTARSTNLMHIKTVNKPPSSIYQPPHKLRNTWISETFAVPVGCECKP